VLSVCMWCKSLYVRSAGQCRRTYFSTCILYDFMHICGAEFCWTCPVNVFVCLYGSKLCKRMCSVIETSDFPESVSVGVRLMHRLLVYGYE